ncbi:MAG: type III-B CRISPR module RAMP protein Cmr1 [Chloroflexota bacterium]|nr:type III-B CRISPR module RAMP protein Cmr1 [Chloroflexota bacterium]
MIASWAKRNPPPSLVFGDRREPLLDLSFRLITPLYGGGAVARESDPLMPVRASSIRGALRYWWRACNAASARSAAELFAHESLIWGAAHRSGSGTTAPSSVEVQVASFSPAEPVSKVYAPGSPGLSYALFPFEGNRKQTAANAIRDLEFRLHFLAVPGLCSGCEEHVRAEVRAAVWAWVTFGGVGARTRRGCGALFCLSPEFQPPSGRDAAFWIQQQATKYARGGSGLTLVPSLHGAQVLVNPTSTSPTVAWERAVARMRDFRLSKRNRPDGSMESKQRPWPEFDSLRRQLDISSQISGGPHPAAPCYPRADFGMPLQFTYVWPEDKDREVTVSTAEHGSHRMASPVILKPLAVSAHDAVPLIAVLRAPHAWDERVPTVRINNDKTLVIPCEQLHDTGKNALVNAVNRSPDVRAAFLQDASRHWQTPVTPIKGAS